MFKWIKTILTKNYFISQKDVSAKWTEIKNEVDLTVKVECNCTEKSGKILNFEREHINSTPNRQRASNNKVLPSLS